MGERAAGPRAAPAPPLRAAGATPPHAGQQHDGGHQRQRPAARRQAPGPQPEGGQQHRRRRAARPRRRRRPAPAPAAARAHQADHGAVLVQRRGQPQPAPRQPLTSTSCFGGTALAGSSPPHAQPLAPVVERLLVRQKAARRRQLADVPGRRRRLEHEPAEAKHPPRSGCPRLPVATAALSFSPSPPARARQRASESQGDQPRRTSLRRAGWRSSAASRARLPPGRRPRPRQRRRRSGGRVRGGLHHFSFSGRRRPWRAPSARSRGLPWAWPALDLSSAVVAGVHTIDISGTLGIGTATSICCRNTFRMRIAATAGSA